MRVLRDLVGETLSDRYRLIARVSGGGMGDVFRAHDLLLDRPVAVKVLQPSLAADPALVERFKQEARSAARLNHPNIVAVHDWGAEDERTYYMVMEYVPGTDLREVLTLSGPLEPGQAVEVVAAVCDALAVAHDSGLIHRDIKPENILIAKDGTVKVADFGIAAVVDAEMTLPGGTIPGTLRYLAPEQSRGEEATLLADIWAVGALLFELLTGEPLAEGTGVDALQRRAVEEPRVPSDLDDAIPTALDTIVRRAGSPEPSRRFADASEMANELRVAPVEASDPVKSLLDDVTGDIKLPDMTPTTFIPGRRRRKRRMRSMTFIAAVLMAFVVIGAAGAAFVRGRDVNVPGVVGMRVSRARQQLETAGLEMKIVDRKRAPSTDAGEIISQEPKGIEVERGTGIAVVVSAGLPLSDVPDVVGIDLSAARVRIHAAELEVGKLSVEFSIKKKGTVIEQSPKDGRLEWGNTVSLVVSRGPRPIEVPDVAGLTLTKAEETLRHAGFKPVVAEVYSDDVAKGRVVGTFPSGGEIAGEGTEVTIHVSAGPRFKKVRLPDVRGMSVNAAQAELESVGLRVRVEESCAGGTTVVETHPIPGTVVRENDVIALFVC